MMQSPSEGDWRAALPRLRIAASPLLAAVLCGCVSYPPPQLAVMSNLELCELELVQRMNLADATREALAAELARRKVECQAYFPAVQARLRADLYERTYFNQSP